MSQTFIIEYYPTLIEKYYDVWEAISIGLGSRYPQFYNMTSYTMISMITERPIFPNQTSEVALLAKDTVVIYKLTVFSFIAALGQFGGVAATLRTLFILLL